MKLLFTCIFILLVYCGKSQKLLTTTFAEINAEIQSNPNIKNVETFFKGTSKILIAIKADGGRIKYKFMKWNDIVYSVYYCEPTEQETKTKFLDYLSQGDYETTQDQNSYRKKGTTNFFYGLDTDDFGRVWYGWEQIPL